MPELQEALLKAVYAGHKYLIASDETCEAVFDNQQSAVDIRHMRRWEQEWRKWTKIALELHEQSGNPAS